MSTLLENSSDTGAQATPEKRRRGRPRKEEVLARQANQEEVVVVEKRPRGRPRKIKEEEPKPIIVETPVEEVSSAPKKRGRPRKNVEPHLDNDRLRITPKQLEDFFSNNASNTAPKGSAVLNALVQPSAANEDEEEEDIDDLVSDVDEFDGVESDNVLDVIDNPAPQKTFRSYTDIAIKKVVLAYNDKSREVPRRRLRNNLIDNNSSDEYFNNVKALDSLGLKPYLYEDNTEPYMCQKQRFHIRTILLRMKANLVEQLQRTVQDLSDAHTNFADELDKASQDSDIAIDVRNREREHRLMLKIDESITRLDSDKNFGYCIKCGDQIGLRRLEIRPTADQCVTCKEKTEIAERQISAPPSDF